MRIGRIIAIVGIAAIVLYVALGILYSYALFGTFSFYSGFDSDRWKAQFNKNEDNNPRHGMVVDLEREVLRKGLSREEVRELLGQPEGVDHNIDVYSLGVSPFGIDYDFYFIEYDEEGKIVDFYIRWG